MMTVEDCRRKAAQWLGKAQLASDPKTSASMRRASEAWTALAQQIERAAFRRPQFPAPMRRPADLAKPRNIYDVDTVQAGDVLRSRLHLSDKAHDDIS
jgi:hypothetical protein